MEPEGLRVQDPSLRQAWWSPAHLIDAVMLCVLLMLPRGPQFTVSPEQSQRAGLGKPPTHWPGLRGWPGVRRPPWDQEVADGGFSEGRE